MSGSLYSPVVNREPVIPLCCDDLVISRLLFGFTKDVDVPTGLVRSIRYVITSAALAQGTDLCQFLSSQFHLLEVVTNARWRDRFGDYTVSAVLRPSKALRQLASDSR